MKKNSIGSWITLGHPSIAEIMAHSNFDWLCIDMEHSVIDYFEAQQLISTIQSKGILAFVRVGENNTRIIKRVLDAGAEGIIVPFVNSKTDAENAVESVKYPPWGKRGVNSLSRAQNYGFGFEEYARTVNEKTSIIVQIEHIDAVHNLESILSVDGVDGYIVGLYDLSGSMGITEQFDHPDLIDAMNTTQMVATKLNKTGGIHIVEPDIDDLKAKISDGQRFIAYSVDIRMLDKMCRVALESFKGLSE